MNLLEKAAILHFHRHRIAVGPPGGYGALGWRAEASQTRRFEILAEVGDFAGAGVLDIGCGYGDFKAFLDRRCAGFTYIGIDLVPEFVALARERYAGRPDTHFFQSDFVTAELPETDYVVASGALGYRCQDPGFACAAIGKFFRAARRGLAFNLLDAAAFPEHDLLVGHDPEAIMAHCRSLSPKVRLTRGYLEDDFTVMVWP